MYTLYARLQYEVEPHKTCTHTNMHATAAIAIKYATKPFTDYEHIWYLQHLTLQLIVDSSFSRIDICS